MLTSLLRSEVQLAVLAVEDLKGALVLQEGGHLSLRHRLVRLLLRGRQALPGLAHHSRHLLHTNHPLVRRVLPARMPAHLPLLQWRARKNTW